MLGTLNAESGSEHLELVEHELANSRTQMNNTHAHKNTGSPVNVLHDLTNTTGFSTGSLDDEEYKVKHKHALPLNTGESTEKLNKFAKLDEEGELKREDYTRVFSVDKAKKDYDNNELKVNLQDLLGGNNFVSHDDFYNFNLSKGSQHEISNFEFRKELESLSRLANSLRQQYRDLERVGVIEAQENFIKYKAATEEKIQSCQEYSDYLEKKVEKLEIDALKSEEAIHSLTKQRDNALRELGKLSGKTRQLDGAGAKYEPLKEATDVNNTSPFYKDTNDTDKKTPTQKDSNYISTLENTVKLYKELTGMNVYGVENLYSHDSVTSDASLHNNTKSMDSLVFWCKQAGRKGQINYNLIVSSAVFDLPQNSPDKKNMFIYKPIKDDIPFRNEPNKNQSSLTDWHKTSVEFERKMASLFFWRLSSYLHDQNWNSKDNP